ncbi:MAG: hypothetical protein JXA36_02225 [Coriobacteriia bacterium]|nr:hypothetical protein [Coriobacteriia bacterium]
MGKHGRSGISKKARLYIALGVVLALAAGGTAWAVYGPGADKTKDDSAETTATDSVETTETAESTETAVSDEESDGVETNATVIVPPSALEPEGGDAPPAVYDPNATPATVEQQATKVLSVASSGGSYTLKADYVLFLTGGEAADAAFAHGDESPPPNDYYIVNDNTMIRDLPIAADATVRVVTNNDGTSNPTGYSMTLASWVSALSGPNANAFKSGIYWISLTNGYVVSIEQLYLP